MKVLLVDDESAARNGLRQFIHWGELGIDEVFAEGTVEEALRLIAREKPEILISDICMPRMNGIEFCREVRKLHPGIRIIFLSGYSDKEYLLGAIELSAEAYIEKPVDIKKMEACIQETADRIRKDYGRLRKEKELEELAGKGRGLREAYCIRELTRGHFPAEELREFSIDRSDRNWYQWIIFQGPQTDSDVSEKLLRIREKLYSRLKEIRMISSFRGENQLLCLISGTEDEKLRRGDLDTEVFLEWLRKFCLSENLFGVIAPKEKGSARIAGSYTMACAALQEVFFDGYGQAIRAEDTDSCRAAESQQESDRRSAVWLRAFSAAVREQDGEEQERIIGEIRDFYRTQKELLPNTVKNFIFRLILLTLREDAADAVLPGGNRQREDDYLWETMNRMETLSECLQELKRQLKRQEERRQYRAGSHTILKIMEYIQKNHADVNLSLKDIADAVGLTPPYLSTIFKNSTGKTIGRFIREVRLDHALRLMEDPRESLASVASSCGYTDQNYFAKVFKKEYGYTPSEYREKVL